MLLFICKYFLFAAAKKQNWQIEWIKEQQVVVMDEQADRLKKKNLDRHSQNCLPTICTDGIILHQKKRIKKNSERKKVKTKCCIYLKVGA